MSKQRAPSDRQLFVDAVDSVRGDVRDVTRAVRIVIVWTVVFLVMFAAATAIAIGITQLLGP